jgi:hypothetical protein
VKRRRLFEINFDAGTAARSSDETVDVLEAPTLSTTRT